MKVPCLYILHWLKPFKTSGKVCQAPQFSIKILSNIKIICYFKFEYYE